MIILKNGCRRSEIKILPNNLSSLTDEQARNVNCFVYCRYYDPAFKHKYPKGFPYRKSINGFTSLKLKIAAAKVMKEDIEMLLDKELYNPITKEYYNDNDSEFSERTLVFDAMEKVQKYIKGSEKYLYEISRIVKNVKPVFKNLGFDNLKISELKKRHIKIVLENSKLTEKNFNKYRIHLKRVFDELIEFGCMEENPCSSIKKKITQQTKREIFDDEKLKYVHDYLKDNYYYFFRYFKIFFYSGARSEELFKLQKKHVRLEQKEYDLLIQKRGGTYQWETKVILPAAIQYWKEILDLAKNDDNYLFSRGMIPGPEKINPWQISRRWRERIKKTDKIKDKNGNTVVVTEDFYSLKHYFLDKLDEAQNIKYSQVMGSHKSDKTTTSHYTVNRDKRTRNALKKLDIDLFGDIK